MSTGWQLRLRSGATLVIALAGLLPWWSMSLAAQPTRGSEQVSAQQGTRRQGAVRVPFPSSIKPAEVVANIKSWAEQTSIVTASGISELAMKNGPLRARRMLAVNSLITAPYFVVELQDESGRDIANVAISQSGDHLMSVEDVRNVESERPLGLEVAAGLVRMKRGRAPQKLEYQYFRNPAERGSIFRPLVAIETESGTLFLNSKRQVFVDESGPLMKEFGRATSQARRAEPDGSPRLAMVAEW